MTPYINLTHNFKNYGGQLARPVAALRTVAPLTDRNKQVQYVCDSVSIDVTAGTAPVREDLQHVLNVDHAVAIDVCAATFINHVVAFIRYGIAIKILACLREAVTAEILPGANDDGKGQLGSAADLSPLIDNTLNN